MSNVIPSSASANLQPFVDKLPTFIGTRKADDGGTDGEIGEQHVTSSAKSTLNEVLRELRAKFAEDEEKADGGNDESSTTTTTTTTTTQTVSESGGRGLSHKDYLSAVFNGTLANVSDQRAAATVDKFMSNHGFEHLSKTQMQQMADTGYLTKNGHTTYVGGNKGLMNAVDKMTKGDFALFDKLNAPTSTRTTTTTKTLTIDEDDEQDVGPSEFTAARRMGNFQKATGELLLTREQMQSIADDGKFIGKDGKTVYAPEGVQAAAAKMMAGGGVLFDKMESATDGTHDGFLGAGDYDQALTKGIIGAHASDDTPLARTRTTTTTTVISGNDTDGDVSDSIRDFLAAAAMARFQKTHGVASLSREQLQEIADTGSFTDAAGNTVDCPEMKQAAQRIMADDGALFDKVESASDDVKDGKLGANNFFDAMRKGDIGLSQPETSSTRTVKTTTTETHGLSERDAFNAARSVANWQDESGNASLTKDQLKEID
ncbi:MAG: hypothetical protein ACRYF5_16575 [Janthinobacterium lividum]